MSRYTSAYTSFCANIEEVIALRKLALRFLNDDLQRNSQISNYLCRGAVVLLSGHIEAYVKDIGDIFFERCDSSSDFLTIPGNYIAFYLSKDVIDDIKDTSDRGKISQKISTLFRRDHEYWSQTKTFSSSIPSKRFNKGFSTPKYDRIKAYFGRFGYTGYDTHMKSIFRSDFTSFRNSIDLIVDLRNNIAHGNNNTNPTPTEVAEMTDVCKKFIRATDDNFAKWCKLNIFSIR